MGDALDAIRCPLRGERISSPAFHSISSGHELPEVAVLAFLFAAFTLGC